MKVEQKNKKELSFENTYAFRLENGIGFISEDDSYFVMWWNRDNCPTLHKIVEPNTCPTLKECLVESLVMEKEDDILEVYGENDFELVLKEL